MDDETVNLNNALERPGSVETPGSGTPNADNVTEGGKEKRGEWIPKARFDQVIGERNRYSTELESVTKERQQLTDSLTKATELLAEKEEDSKIVTELRRLANDPKARPLLEKLDKMVQGIEDEVDSGKTTPQDGQARTLELIKQTRDELANEIADQRAEHLLARADTIASKFLAELPSEYDVDDKEQIAQIWSGKVDWEGVEKDPTTLPQKLSESLQKVLDAYGEPKGLLRQQAKQAPTTVVTPTITPEQELQHFMEKDYGSLKEVKTPSGKTVLTPEMSNEDFDKELAKAMRAVYR